MYSWRLFFFMSYGRSCESHRKVNGRSYESRQKVNVNKIRSLGDCFALWLEPSCMCMQLYTTQEVSNGDKAGYKSHRKSRKDADEREREEEECGMRRSAGDWQGKEGERGKDKCGTEKTKATRTFLPFLFTVPVPIHTRLSRKQQPEGGATLGKTSFAISFSWCLRTSVAHP